MSLKLTFLLSIFINTLHLLITSHTCVRNPVVSSKILNGFIQKDVTYGLRDANLPIQEWVHPLHHILFKYFVVATMRILQKLP